MGLGNVEQIGKKSFQEILGKDHESIYDEQKSMIDDMTSAKKELLKYEFHLILKEHANETNEEIKSKLKQKIDEVNGFETNRVIERTRELLNNLREDVTADTQDVIEKARKDLVGKVDKAIEKKGFLGKLISFIGGGDALVSMVEDSKKVDPEAGFFDKIWTKVLGGIATFFLGKLGFDNLTDTGSNTSTSGEETPDTSSLEKSKIAATYKINEEYSKYKQNEYTKENWILLQETKDKGIIKISESNIADIEEIVSSVIQEMRDIDFILERVKTNAVNEILVIFQAYMDSNISSNKKDQIEKIKDEWVKGLMSTDSEIKDRLQLENNKGLIIKQIQEIANREEKEVIETMSGNTQYLLSAKFIMALSGNENNRNNFNDILLKELRNYNILQLNGNRSKIEKDLKVEDDIGQKNALDYIITSFTSPNVEKLLRYGLKVNILKRIFCNLDGSIKDKYKGLFGISKIDASKSRIQEIIEGLEKGDLDISKDLSIEEISILYSKTIPGIGLLGIDNLGTAFGSSIGIIFSGGTEIDSSNIESPLSDELIKLFTAKGGVYFGKHTFVEKNFQDLCLLLGVNEENLDKEKKDELESLVNFKDRVYGDGRGNSEFLNNLKLGLNDDQKDIFSNNLDYRGVIAIYSILGSTKSLQDLNPVSLVSLIFTISHIIGETGENKVGNKFESSKYLGNYIKSVILTPTELDLTDEEKEVMGIYKDYLFNHYIISQLSEYSQILGLPAGFFGESMYDESAEIFGVGLVTKELGKILISKGLKKGTVSMLGLFLKKAGWLGILGGLAIGGMQFAQNNSKNFHKLGEDLNESVEKGDYQAAIRALELYRDSIKEYTLKDGEKINFVCYPGEVPYVSYKGRPYSFGIVKKGVDFSFGSILQNLSGATLNDSFNTLDGRTISTDIHVSGENGFIIYGDENGEKFEINVNELLISFEGKELNTTTGSELFDWLSSLGRGGPGEANYKMPIIPDADYIDLGEISGLKNLYLVLSPIETNETT